VQHTRIKICGLTRVAHVRAAAAAGVDAIGLNFHPSSPRYVDPETARTLAAAAPPFLTVVGLFVDATPADIDTVLARVPLHMLQFHGDETPAACAAAPRPWLKAVRMREGLDVAEAMATWDGAAGVLLDAYLPGVPGGTGETFDWDRIPAERTRPLILAGGLDPGNVGDAVRRVRPFAVDVSGGVERARGEKDAGRIEDFVAAVRAADAEHGHSVTGITEAGARP
jgi:phosphoribosylanthranilate isomerase